MDFLYRNSIAILDDLFRMTIYFPMVLGPKPHLHPGLKIRNRIRAPMGITSKQNATTTNILASVQFKSVFESNFRDFRKPLLKKNENENYLTVISNNDEKYSTFKNDEKDWIKLDNEEKEWIKLNVGGIKVPIPISFLGFYYYISSLYRKKLHTF